MQSKTVRLLIIIFLGISARAVASTSVVDISILQPTDFLSQAEVLVFQNDETVVVKPKLRKLKAVLLAVFLGHFGVHRIYLGTKENVPVVYSLTLGGGLGLLPLFDIIAILSTKDIDQFVDNNKIFMWSRPKRN